MLGLRNEWLNGLRYEGPLRQSLRSIYVELDLYRRKDEFSYSDSEAESDEEGAISDSSQLGETYAILNEQEDGPTLKEVRLSHPFVKRDLDSFHLVPKCWHR